MKKEKFNNDLVLYQAKNGALEFKTDVQKETIWLTQAQIAQVFDTTVQNINIHLKRIFISGELSQNSVIKDFLITAADGKRYKTWFLRVAGILDMTRMTPPALTAIAILNAESHPKQKEKMIGLVLQLLKS